MQCREIAQSSYHKYECKMKLYEMLHLMGDKYIDVFMAIRTITQYPLEYFTDRKDKIWQLLDDDYPEMRSK